MSPFPFNKQTQKVFYKQEEADTRKAHIEEIHTGSIWLQVLLGHLDMELKERDDFSYSGQPVPLDFEVSHLKHKCYAAAACVFLPDL